MDEQITVTAMEPEVLGGTNTGRFPWNADTNPKPVLNQALPIVGGVAAGALIGLVLCKFVVNPLIAKHKAKKAAAAAEASTEEKEEPAKKEE